jgi:non-specific serine/threonine protein kinase
MPKLRTVALVLGGVVFLSLPLLAVVDVPGERRVKELVGVNVDGCGPIRNTGDEADWREEPDTPTLRDGPSSAVIGDKVYLVGGIGRFSDDYEIAHSVDAVESFDVRTRRWEKLPRLPRALNHVNLAAAGGSLYALGGTSDRFGKDIATTESWRYDVAERRWEELPAMPTPRAAAGVAVAGDEIYVVGGRDHEISVDANESFNVRTRRWTRHADLPTRRDHVGAVSDGRSIYALGGRQEEGASFKVMERYDIERDAWSRETDVPEPKAGFAFVETPVGFVAAGGENIDKWTLYGGIYAYDPAGRRWRALQSMAEPRHGFAGEYVDGRFYSFGGSRCSGFYPVRASSSTAIG